jgi:hypothetical protein
LKRQVRGIADPQPNDCWPGLRTQPAEGEILVLGENHCALAERVIPHGWIRRVPQSDLRDMTGLVTSANEQRGKCRWQLRVDQNFHLPAATKTG